MSTAFNNTALADNKKINLDGRWKMQLDPHDHGIKQQWFNNTLSDSVKLPGTLDENKKGIKNDAKPEFKTETFKRLARKYKYTGPAWYQRQIDIPKDWAGKRIILNLERIIWESTVWIDNNQIGLQDSLVTPHVFDISQFASTGKHTLTIRIDNSYKYNVGSHPNHPGPLGHAYTEETQTIWNGIIGDISLYATDKLYIEDVQIYPDLAKKIAKVKINIANQLSSPASGTITLQSKSLNSSKKHIVEKLDADFSISNQEKLIEIDYPMEDYLPWDEFSPTLYELSITCNAVVDGKELKDEKTVTFGMREFKADRTAFKINDRQMFLRGTLECCIFPLTGHPPTDVRHWQRIFSIAKSYGLNHLRFHSWCPPEAAFTAADQIGFYLQTELPIWVPNVGQEPKRDKFMIAEAHRILKTYGNHPSFCLLSMGNELNGDYDFLHSLVADLKNKDSRHLYTSTTYTFQTPHGEWPEEGDDFFITQKTKKGWVRGQGYVNQNRPSTNYDFKHAIEDMPVPLITHEIGQSTVYPDMDEIKKYKGVLQPLNFIAIKNDLAEKGLLEQSREFTNATGKFSTGLYKAEIELALRSTGTAGFQLLDLHDFPGQGTALIGILDPFWDSKGFIEPEDFRRFCSETVLLARMPQRVYYNDETFKADIEIAHFGPEPLKDAQTIWTVRNQKGTKIACGHFPRTDIPIGSGTNLGDISIVLNSVNQAEKLNLEVKIKGADTANDWNIWVYPAQLEINTTDDIFITQSLDDKLLQAIDEGKKILFLPKPSLFKFKIPGCYTPVFWSPVHFTNQPGTMGVICDPKHLALKNFPTDYYSDWQWWDLNINSVVFRLDDLSSDIEPIVQIVDNFTRNHKLATAIELKVADADMIICSIDLTDNLDSRPAAKQLKYSLTEYMKSKNFSPKSKITIEKLMDLFRKATAMTNASVISADSSQSGYPPENVIDGNPDTIWSTAWSPEIKPHPHEIVIDLGKELEIKGFTYLPRQDGNPNGWIKDYQFYISSDGKNWQKPVAQGYFEQNNSLKKVSFYDALSIYSDSAIKGRFLRLVAVSGFGSDPYTTIAELGVITD